MTTIHSTAAARFQKGRSVYTCATCGRRTRETLVSGSDDCADCFDLAGLQNSVWDGCFDEYDARERDNILGAIVKKGGDASRVRKSMSDLFAAKTCGAGK